MTNKTNNVVMPDFDTWAFNVWPHNSLLQTRVKQALQQAFDQGYALGKREHLTIGSVDALCDRWKPL